MLACSGNSELSWLNSMWWRKDFKHNMVEGKANEAGT